VTRSIVFVSLALLLIDGLIAGIPVLPPLPLALLNLAYVWIFAENVEDRLGRAPFLAFYAICSVAGALAQVVLRGGETWAMLGSSSGTAGVLGAYMVLFWRSRVLVLFPAPPLIFEVPALLLIAMFPTTAAIFGLSISVQIAVGFGVGALLCLVLRRPVQW
jgi:membrane associated rhomboid family serine protease